MTYLRIIDDSLDRHRQFKALLNDLNGSTVEYRADLLPDGLDDNQVDEYIKNSLSAQCIYNDVTSAPPGSVFLVDLKLRRAMTTAEEEACFREAVRLLSSSNSRDLERAAAEIENVFSAYNNMKAYPIAVFICVVSLKLQSIPILISTAAYDEAEQFAEAYGVKHVPGKANVANPLKAYPQGWGDEIRNLNRHPNVIIREILNQYFSPLSSFQSVWEHGNGETVPYACETVAAKDLGNRIWNTCLDDTANKALHCRTEWKLLGPRLFEHRFLEAAVTRLGLDCSVEYSIPASVDGKVRFCLPVEPGIAFLLSLKELVTSMTSDGKPPPKGISFERKGDLLSLTIYLNSETCSAWGMVKRFLNKGEGRWKYHPTFDGNVCERIPGGGLSEAIFHLGHSRLNGIVGDEPWAKMFRNGSPDWIAWPSFGESSITYHWHI
jgi:hypothetical protein